MISVMTFPWCLTLDVGVTSIPNSTLTYLVTNIRHQHRNLVNVDENHKIYQECQKHALVGLVLVVVSLLLMIFATIIVRQMKLLQPFVEFIHKLWSITYGAVLLFNPCLGCTINNETMLSQKRESFTSRKLIPCCPDRPGCCVTIFIVT